MRLYASNELKSRLTHAAANGSVIAADIRQYQRHVIPLDFPACRRLIYGRQYPVTGFL